jgi:hypothetical protein
MEELWNQRWTTGGYARYNTSSEPDPGGGWPFASLYIARANVEAGNSVKVWQVLNWLETIHGGLSGGWFERYGPSITPPAPPVCITGWTWAEVVMLVVQHIMGLRPDLNRLILRPRLISGIDTMRGVFALRGSRIDVSVRRTGTVSARVNNKTVPADGDRLVVKYPARGTTLRIDMTV